MRLACSCGLSGTGWPGGSWPAASARPRSCWAQFLQACIHACYAWRTCCGSGVPQAIYLHPCLTQLFRLIAPPQMEVLLPMTVRFANPIQCGGSWGFVRYHGFFT